MLSRSVRLLITTTRAALPRPLAVLSPSRFLISRAFNSSSRLQAFEPSSPEQPKDVLKTICKLLTEEREASRNEIEARLLRQLDEVRAVMGEVSKEAHAGVIVEVFGKLADHRSEVKELIRCAEGRILYPDTGGEPVWLDILRKHAPKFDSQEQQDEFLSKIVPELMHGMRKSGDARNRERLRKLLGEPWKKERRRLGYKRKERRRSSEAGVD
ncbi:hypothetical protein JCM8097_007434 [Rhodosporidiobolus ruineniae]